MAFIDTFDGATDYVELENRSGWGLIGAIGSSNLETYNNGIHSTGEGGGTGSTAYGCTDQGAADHYVIPGVYTGGGTNSATNVFASIRIVDKDNFVGVGLYANNSGSFDIRLVKCVANVVTILKSNVGRHTGNETLRLWAVGDQYRIEYTDPVETDATHGPYTVLNSEIATSTTRAGFVTRGRVNFNTKIWEGFEHGAGDGTAAADTTPPVWGANQPAISATAKTSVTVSGQIDEEGTMYAVAVPDGAAAPSSAQVKAGTNASDIAAPSSSIALLAAAPDSLTITGLAANTAYDVYVVAEDDEVTPNLQVSPVKLDVTTAANTVTTTLKSLDASQLRANLSSLRWAWFDAFPGIGNAPTAFGVTEGTDASGWIVVEIAGSSLTPGQQGYLALQDAANGYIGLYALTVD